MRPTFARIGVDFVLTIDRRRTAGAGGIAGLLVLFVKLVVQCLDGSVGARLETRRDSLDDEYEHRASTHLFSVLLAFV